MESQDQRQNAIEAKNEKHLTLKGVAPDPGKVKAITKWLEPHSQT